jgi:hypothetical protein
MIPTPYRFEAGLSDDEFKKVGQFAFRWSHIDHTIGNCLRRILDMDPKQATILIFPLSLDLRMARIEQAYKLLSRLRPVSPESKALFDELKPLIKAMQFLRNSILHGIVVDLGGDEEPIIHLRSKDRTLTKAQLFSCEDLINYTAHVVIAFRLSLGEKDDDRGRSYALPDRPPIPDFLPAECRSFPQEDKVTRQSPPRSSRA